MKHIVLYHFMGWHYCYRLSFEYQQEGQIEPEYGYWFH
jgi:hypothetical protein